MSEPSRRWLAAKDRARWADFMDAEFQAAFDTLNERLDGIDKRLDGVDKLARTALQETQQLARVVSNLVTDSKVFGHALATLAGMTADNTRVLGELSERVGRLVQTTIEGRSADAERWQDFDQRLVQLEHAVTELQQLSRQ